MFALIKSTLPRFRRAGIEFNSTGVRIDLEALTDNQVEAIYGEPRLIVSLLDLPANQVQGQPQGERGTQPIAAGVGPANAGDVTGQAGSDGADSKPAKAAKIAKPKAS